uniref:Uncharacterized protein n=1 Tax=Oryza brachyantha TaxID=4533 RepID=J3LD98_ORYBR
QPLLLLSIQSSLVAQHTAFSFPSSKTAHTHKKRETNQRKWKLKNGWCRKNSLAKLFHVKTM